MVAVVESHVLEGDGALLDQHGFSVRPILDAERLVVDVDQFFHVVDRALQVAHVHADIAQVALQDEEGGEDAGDVAGLGQPLLPDRISAAPTMAARRSSSMACWAVPLSVPRRQVRSGAVAPFADDERRAGLPRALRRQSP